MHGVLPQGQIYPRPEEENKYHLDNYSTDTHRVHPTAIAHPLSHSAADVRKMPGYIAARTLPELASFKPLDYDEGFAQAERPRPVLDARTRGIQCQEVQRRAQERGPIRLDEDAEPDCATDQDDRVSFNCIAESTTPHGHASRSLTDPSRTSEWQVSNQQVWDLDRSQNYVEFAYCYCSV
jgi:hypothetical protein